MRRALVVLLLSISVLAVAVPIAGPFVKPAEAAQTSWTIMLYMAANAAPELPWEQNINDMESAEQAQGTSIVALVEPLGENTTLYKIAHDPGGLNSVIVSPVIDDGGEVIPIASGNANMGNPETLDSFIQYSASNYPADRYVLVLWGHGAAWRGLCPDGADALTLPELRTALANATGAMSRSIDMVCVDACVGATLEMLFEIHDYVNYFVGSEMDIPTQGLPYGRILNDLATNVNCTAREFGVMIAEDYLSWSRTHSAYSATMAVFNMTAMYPVIAQFTAWVELSARLEGLFHSEMQSAALDAERYENYTEWQVDFGDMENNLIASSVPLELVVACDNLLTAYDRACAYAGSFDNPDATDGVRVRDSMGAVLYCPSTDSVDQGYADLQIASTGWTTLSHMLRRTAESNESKDVPWLSYGSLQDFGPGMHDTVYVNWPSSYELLSVWVFRLQPDGPFLCGVFSGTGDNVTVHGPQVVGDVVLSASAGNGTAVLSHSQLGPVPVTGVVRLAITLLNFTGEDEQVSIVVKSGNRTMFANLTDSGTHVFYIDLLAPHNLTIGATVQVSVDVGKRMSGNGSALVNVSMTSVSVVMSENPSTSNGLALVLVMAVLAAVILLVFLALTRRERKTSGS